MIILVLVGMEFIIVRFVKGILGVKVFIGVIWLVWNIVNSIFLERYENYFRSKFGYILC